MESTSTPSAKALQLDQEGKGNKMLDTASKPCRFWGSESGCKHGRSCKFQHGVLADQAKRCFCCSSTEHRKQDCPYKESQPSTSSSMVGGSGAVGGKAGGGKDKNSKTGNGKGPKMNPTMNGNGKGLGEPQDPKVAAVSSTTTPKEESTTSKTEDGHREQPAEPPKAATGETELVNEVTSLLKSLRIKTSQGSSGPSVKVCQLRKIAGGDRCVLLDGGATHVSGLAVMQKSGQVLRKSRSHWQMEKQCCVNFQMAR